MFGLQLLRPSVTAAGRTVSRFPPPLPGCDAMQRGKCLFLGDRYLFLLPSRTQCEYCRQFLHGYHTLWSHGEHRTTSVATVPVLPLSHLPCSFQYDLRMLNAGISGVFVCRAADPFLRDSCPTRNFKRRNKSLLTLP